MYDIVKDFWEFAIVMIAGIFGFGVMHQKNQNTVSRIDGIEKDLALKYAKCPEMMLKIDCEKNHKDAREVQELIRTQSAKEFADLKTMIADIRTSNAAVQQSNASEHNMIMEHLLNSNWDGKNRRG